MVLTKNFRQRGARVYTKAQMQMMESLVTMFIFFILVVFGIIFFFKYQQISLQEQETEMLAQQAIDISLTALFLPELYCSNGESEPVDNCMDIQKLRGIEQFIDSHKQDYYFDMFGYSGIYVHQIYPEKRNWTVYEQVKTVTLENGEKVPADKEPTFFVITLRNNLGLNSSNQTVHGEFGYGYIHVEAYS